MGELIIIGDKREEGGPSSYLSTVCRQDCRAGRYVCYRGCGSRCFTKAFNYCERMAKIDAED